MKKIPLLLLILACFASSQGIISFNTVYLDSAGKFFFTYPVAVPNPVALKELQKNFIKQKFGEKFLDQDPAAVLGVYKSQFKEVENMSDAVSFPLPGIVQYTTASYIYHVDAAHGQNGFSMSIYALATGKRIELGSLFNKGWEKNVAKLIIREFLLAQNLQSLADYSYTQKEDDFMPENVRINATGMEFVYPAYQIAPHSVGEQSVFLSWNTLKPYLNTRSIIYPKLQF